MSYRDDGNYVPPQKRERPPSRLEWAVAIVGILLGGLMLASAVLGDSGPAWMAEFRGIRLIAALLFIVAVTLLVRAHRNSESSGE